MSYCHCDSNNQFLSLLTFSCEHLGEKIVYYLVWSLISHTNSSSECFSLFKFNFCCELWTWPLGQFSVLLSESPKYKSRCDFCIYDSLGFLLHITNFICVCVCFPLYLNPLLVLWISFVSPSQWLFQAHYHWQKFLKLKFDRKFMHSPSHNSRSHLHFPKK